MENLEELSVLVANCRKNWKGRFGKYPESVWTLALELVKKEKATLAEVALVLRSQQKTVKRRLLNQKKKPVSPFPSQGFKFVELPLQERFSPKLAPDGSEPGPALIMRSKDGAELVVHLGSSTNGVTTSSLLSGLVSCWVSAHR